MAVVDQRQTPSGRYPDFPVSPTCQLCRGLCGRRGAVFHAATGGGRVLNDVNDDLINLYRVVQQHPEVFIRQFKWILLSRPTVPADSGIRCTVRF